MQHRLQGKKVAVVGLGISNVAVIAYLLKQDITGLAVFDTRTNPPYAEELPGNINFHLGPLDGNELKKFDMLVVTPGLSINDPAIVQAREAGAEIVGDIELFAGEAKAPTLGITGSNGKSTVTALVGYMLEKAGMKAMVGANFGHPVFDILSDKAEAYVLELSSFELETTSSLQLEAGVILNVSEDHLDRYDGDLEKYSDAKQRIFNHCKKIIVNRDDPRTYPKDPALHQNIFASFGSDNQEYGREVCDNNQVYLTVNGHRVLDARDLIICGTHNELNALAAMALADAMGISRDVQVQALKNFQGLEHRCQLVRVLDGVSFYNDSKATNVASAVAAIEGLCSRHKEGIILLAGGLGKGQDFSPLKQYFGKEVVSAFCFGKDADKIIEQSPEHCHSVLNLRQAIRFAFESAKPGQAILLSPACASFDQFKGYDERGRVYANIVNNLVSCNLAKIKAAAAAAKAAGVELSKAINKEQCEAKAAEAAQSEGNETPAEVKTFTIDNPTYETVDQVLQIQAEDQEMAAAEAAAEAAAKKTANKKLAMIKKSSATKAKSAVTKSADKTDTKSKTKAKSGSGSKKQGAAATAAADAATEVASARVEASSNASIDEAKHSAENLVVKAKKTKSTKKTK